MLRIMQLLTKVNYIYPPRSLLTTIFVDVLTQLSKEKKVKERERAEMKVIDAAKANQIAAINAAVKFELKDMQLPAITIESENDRVKIPRLGEELSDAEQSNFSLFFYYFP